MPKEQSLLRTCEAYLKKEEARLNGRLSFRKRHGSSYAVAGDPDLYVVYRGFHLEIELKRPGETPTPLQTFRLNQWEKAGSITAVVTCLDELKGILGVLYRVTDELQKPVDLVMQLS